MQNYRGSCWNSAGGKRCCRRKVEQHQRRPPPLHASRDDRRSDRQRRQGRGEGWHRAGVAPTDLQQWPDPQRPAVLPVVSAAAAGCPPLDRRPTAAVRPIADGLRVPVLKDKRQQYKTTKPIFYSYIFTRKQASITSVVVPFKMHSDFENVNPIVTFQIKNT